MKKRTWYFSRNIHGDEIPQAGFKRSVWYRGNGKHFWQYHRAEYLLAPNGLQTFFGTKKELNEHLRREFHEYMYREETQNFIGRKDLE